MYVYGFLLFPSQEKKREREREKETDDNASGKNIRVKRLCIYYKW